METNVTIEINDRSGDAADQATHLREVIDLQAANSPGGWESNDCRGYPLEDTEELISAEEADDSSDDPMHGGGLNPHRWQTAEEAAMHVVDPLNKSGGNDEMQLTPEDETLLGVDPYE